MRILGSIPHPQYKIIVYTLERYYYVEIEAGPMKQCLKLHKEQFAGLQEIQSFMDEQFMNKTHKLFEEIYLNYKEALGRKE